MVAAEIVFLERTLTINGATKLTRRHHQRIFQQTTTSEIIALIGGYDTGAAIPSFTPADDSADD